MQDSLPPMFKNLILFVPATIEEDQKRFALLLQISINNYEVCLDEVELCHSWLIPPLYLQCTKQSYNSFFLSSWL